MRRIFLTGPIGCGKSTLIRNALGESFNCAGGFITKRVLGPENLEGFDITSPDGCGNPEIPRMRFLTFRDGKTERNNEAFSVFAAKLLRGSAGKPFAVIDEIGGFELLLPAFMEAFVDFLALQLPCVGVLKSIPASRKLSRAAGLSEDYLRAAGLFRRRLLSEPDTEILETFGHGDKAALERLTDWKEEYVHYE